MAGAASPSERFAAELDRLVQELWTWSPRRFEAAGRVEALRRLIEAFAAIARAGGGEAPDLPVPRVETHGLADQLAVLGAEVLRVPDAEQAAAAAMEQLLAARAVLLPAARA
jgi:hypothetical protein